MAIPNNPNWSSLTTVGPYPAPGFVKPPPPPGVTAVALGPAEVNNADGRLTQRYYLAMQVGTTVQLQAATT